MIPELHIIYYYALNGHKVSVTTDGKIKKRFGSLRRYTSYIGGNPYGWYLPKDSRNGGIVLKLGDLYILCQKRPQ
jgi:hypothetical protein